MTGRIRGAGHAESRPVLFVLVTAFICLLAYAVRDEPYWVALALSVALLPLAATLSAYYLEVMIGLALVYERRPAATGVAFAVALLAQQTAPLFTASRELPTVIASVAYVAAAVVVLTSWRWRTERG